MTISQPVPEGDTESARFSSVLVIDNDELSLSLIAKDLRQANYRVLTASTAAAGIQQAGLEKPALIITNLAMPDAEGSGLVASLKEGAPEACILAMTDYGAEQLAANALREGAEDYLIRPVQPWELVSAAAEVLERAGLRQRNAQLSEALRQRQAELELRNVELEQANARLREADIWKENLTNMIIHDLKNPLGVVQGTMVYFKGTLADSLDYKQSQLLESALISAERALKLVSAILDVRRLEEGRMPLELQPVAPHEAIQNCLDEIYPLLTMHGLMADMHVSEELPPVRADRNALMRIIGNLIDNAVKFTPAEGHIVLSAHQVSDGICFSVADTGYGIPPEQHERIFEKFAQAGIRAEGQRGGVGLGLTFCKLAVEAHGGRIWVESDRGMGATFHFVLPIWTDEM